MQQGSYGRMRARQRHFYLFLRAFHVSNFRFSASGLGAGHAGMPDDYAFRLRRRPLTRMTFDMSPRCHYEIYWLILFTLGRRKGFID